MTSIYAATCAAQGFDPLRRHDINAYERHIAEAARRAAGAVTLSPASIRGMAEAIAGDGWYLRKRELELTKKARRYRGRHRAV